MYLSDESRAELLYHCINPPEHDLNGFILKRDVNYLTQSMTFPLHGLLKDTKKRDQVTFKLVFDRLGKMLSLRFTISRYLSDEAVNKILDMMGREKDNPIRLRRDIEITQEFFLYTELPVDVSKEDFIARCKEISEIWEQAIRMIHNL